jgi:choline dehydrogenase-like flavoprotein
MTDLISTALYELAHARSGDKGNRLNIAVVCRRPEFYPVLAAQLTAEFVTEAFRARRPTRVVRYDLPRLAAFNFVLDDVLDGGINGSLGLDGHGKTLSFLLLAASVPVPKAVLDAAATAIAVSPSRHEPIGGPR